MKILNVEQANSSAGNREIRIASTNNTVVFAAEELASYIYKMLGQRLEIRTAFQDDINTPGFVICSEENEIATNQPDRFDICTKDGLTTLCGNRPRSCLYAVYAYLEAQGVHFLRPGPDGEIVPKRKRLKTVNIKQRTSHIHRCVEIEGAISIEHALAMIDWMAKRRMNEFQLQFESSIFFWNRWYAHESNPRFGMNKTTGKMKEHVPISVERAVELDNILIADIQKRDMDLHRMGHGWTSRALGVTADGWKEAESSIPDDLRDKLALVNGARDWHKGIPSNTELCYSNPDATDLVVKAVVSYATEHPEANVLLFCQADGLNQHCECDSCAKLSVSDWYARLVNAISDALAEKRLPTRVSFAAYGNTIQAPDLEYIHDKDGKLIFMFAPFFRCYEHSLTDPCCIDDYPVDRVMRNHSPVIVGNRAYIQVLRQWQARCQSDSFLEDYHFIRFHYLFLDEMFVARRVFEDMEDIVPLGFNGFFSCQVLRSFYPTGLGMAVMADKLWDRTANYDDLLHKHMKGAFGTLADEALEYLQGLTAILKPTPSNHDHLIYRGNDKHRAVEALTYLSEATDKLQRMKERARNPVHTQSMCYLVHYNALLQHICGAVAQFASGDTEEAKLRLDGATMFACDTEEETHWALDTWMVNYWNTERIARWSGGPKWFQETEKH